MKKLKIVLVAVLLCVFSLAALAVSGCGHTHKPSSDYGQSHSQHWQVCETCGEEIENTKLDHNDSDKDHKCDDCGYYYGYLYRLNQEDDTYSASLYFNTTLSGDIEIPEMFNRKKVTKFIDDCGDTAARKITSIKIPASINSIESTPSHTVFEYFFALESITVDEGNQTYMSRDGILYNKAGTEVIYTPYKLR